MAKKKSGWSVGWLEVAIAGIAGFGLYKWLSSSSTTAPAAAALPTPGAPGTPPASAAPAAPGSLPARGPAYQGWLNTIVGLNNQFLSGQISLPVLQQKLSEAQSAINKDWVAGRLTTADMNDLSADITTYGG